ncbi:hypothetical protein ACJJTC_018034 [Scirpophaga incertulas]
MLARCDDNVSEACRQYAIRFPNLRTPSHVTMLAATQRLRDYGQFRANTMRDSGRPPTHTVREQEDILDFFEIYPAASTNDAARRFNVTQYFAWSVIHGEGKYPFHFHRAQELTEPDKPARAAFCNWCGLCVGCEGDYFERYVRDTHRHPRDLNAGNRIVRPLPLYRLRMARGGGGGLLRFVNAREAYDKINRIEMC